MKKNGFINTVLAVSLVAGAAGFSVSGGGTASAASNSVVIAEIFNASQETQEWVTLANVSDTAVNLTGWKLQDYTGSGNAWSDWTFPDVTIAPNSLLVVERSAGASDAQTTGVQSIVGGLFSFAAASDRLDLINAASVLVDGVAWGGSNQVEGFSVTASGFASNQSLERTSRVDTDTAADWTRVTSNPSAGNWAPLTSGEEEPGEDEGYEATVTQVTDGDTIKISPAILGADTVRLLSIDTPEAYYLGHNQNPHAAVATEALESLLPVGTVIRVKPGVESIDAYGRLLAHIYKDELDINQELIRLGHAVPYFIGPNLEHFDEYRAAYLEAKEAERGIWNPAQPLEQLPYEFRFTLRGGPDKFVGDYDTKKYVIPTRWQEVDTGNRVFFYEKSVARAAGYEPLDPSDPDPEPIPDPDVLTLTIAEARQQTGLTKVKIQGEVTAVFPSNAWIDDGEAGIRLFGNEVSNLVPGEEVEIVGTVSDFYTDVEVTSPVVAKLTGADRFTPPPPFALSLLSQAGQEHAGRLITLQEVTIKENYDISAGGVVITDGTGAEMIVYAQAGAEIKTYLQQLPKDRSYNFTGVAASFNDKVQIFPRSAADIAEAGSQPGEGGSITGSVLAQGRNDHSGIVLEAVNEATGEAIEFAGAVAADGSFSITGLAPGIYELRARFVHYIPVATSGLTVTAEQGTDAGLLSAAVNGGSGDGKMRGGDLVDDGIIDIYDAVLIGVYYSRTTPEALAAADVNGDGKVDSADLELVRGNMLPVE